MTTSSYRAAAFLAAAGLLAGCGDGGAMRSFEVVGAASSPYAPIDDTTSTEATTLTYLAFDTAKGTSTLDHTTGTLTGGVLAGTFDADRTEITTTSGTIKVGDPSGTLYVRTIQTNGAGPLLFGVFGEAADLSVLSGAADFLGTVKMSATSGGESYVLDGHVLITADLASMLVDSTFYDLSGKRNAEVSVSNVGTITIEDAAISGSGFSEGTASGTGIFVLSGAELLDGTEGMFFGPGTEVGGLLLIDDTASTDVLVQGVYTAKN